MKLKKPATLLSLVLIFLLHQNCGSELSSRVVDSIDNSSSIAPDEILTDRMQLSTVYNLESFSSDRSLSMVFVSSPRGTGSGLIDLVLFDPEAKVILSETTNTKFISYLKNPPKQFRGHSDNSYQVLRSEDSSSLMLFSMSVVSFNIEIIWEQFLESPLTQVELEDSYVIENEDARAIASEEIRTIAIGDHRIIDFESRSPLVEIRTGVTNCFSPDEHLEDGVCVSNFKMCYIANGGGAQTWSGSAYRSCRPTSCSSGYVINGLTCSRLTCSADRHREGNVCVRNVRSCSISNGVGSQTWSESSL